MSFYPCVAQAVILEVIPFCWEGEQQPVTLPGHPPRSFPEQLWEFRAGKCSVTGSGAASNAAAQGKPGSLFSQVKTDRTRGNGLKQGRFRLSISKTFFSKRVVRHWNCPEGRGWVSIPWGILKICADLALGDVVYSSELGSWSQLDSMILKVISTLNDSMICDVPLIFYSRNNMPQVSQVWEMLPWHVW